MNIHYPVLATFGFGSARMITLNNGVLMPLLGRTSVCLYQVMDDTKSLAVVTRKTLPFTTGILHATLLLLKHGRTASKQVAFY